MANTFLNAIKSRVTQIVPSTCFLPSAVKPWQKACCVSIGCTVVGIGIYSVNKLVDNSISKYNESLTNAHKYAHGTLSNVPTWIYSVLFGVITPITTVFTGVYNYHVSKIYINFIRNNMKCCSIIRASLIAVPMISMGSFGILTGCIISYSQFNKWYHQITI